MIRVLLTALALCCTGLPGARADDEGGPIEIDFSTLEGIKDDYNLRIRVVSADGTRTTLNISVGGGSRTTNVAGIVKDALPKVVDAEHDGVRVVIKSFQGKPVASVEFGLKGVPEGTKEPIVKRLPKKEK